MEVKEFLVANNLGAEPHTSSTFFHQQPQTRIGYLVPIIKKMHYDDWYSLKALDDNALNNLVPDSQHRRKLTDLIQGLPPS